MTAAACAVLMSAAGLWAAGSAAATGSTSGSTTGSATASSTGIAPVTACADATSFDLLTISGANAQITSAAPVAASANPQGAWAACELQGIIAPETHFTIYLPTSTYAGEYLQTGCGGLCGNVGVNVAADSGCAQMTDGNFAVASDDEGHESNTALFSADPELKAEFGYESEHQLATVAKAVLKDFYGSAPTESYFDGCSDGGREALLEAQRYPTDFNGIVAGSPASIQTELNTFMEGWNAQANTAADGTAILTSADLTPLHDDVLQACGGSTAQTLGYLADPLACDWNPASIACKAGQTSTASDFCLTAAQVVTVDKLYSGPRDAKGNLLYPGWEVRGSELNWAGWIVPMNGDEESTAMDANIATQGIQGLVNATGTYNGSQTYMDVKFDGATFEKYTSENDGELDMIDPDLSAFEKAGGKLILWAGYADPAINPVGTIAYYQSVVKTTGGLDATEQFARLFLLPGVAHCGGGQGVSNMDALTAITDWVTKGGAPSSLLTSQTGSGGTVTATRPVYAYPNVAVDTTGGSIYQASSYTPEVSKAEENLNVRWLGGFRSGYETVSGWVNGQWVTRPASGSRNP